MEEFKFKPLTKAQILISMDRLTRFKSTEDKYLRVFKDILVTNLIFPKFKKNHLDTMHYEVLNLMVETIFNHSLTHLGHVLSNDYSINKKLLDYEKSVFDLEESIQILIDNKLDYISALKLFVRANCH